MSVGNTDHFIARVKVRDAGAPIYGPGYAVTRPKRRARKGNDKNSAEIGTSSKRVSMRIRLIDTLFDEVLKRPPDPIPTDDFPPVSDEFLSSPFLAKLKDLGQLEAIPTLSQAARQKAIWPTHSSEKRKRILDIQARLKRNDGGMVRCRLNSEGIDDSILKLIVDVLPDNIYLQHLMLHDNVITDKGVRDLCKSLQLHPSIHTLWLGGNRITDLGVEYISELLTKNQNLKVSRRVGYARYIPKYLF